MKHTVFLAAVMSAAIAVTGGTALARSGGHGHGPRIDFETMDRDGDGQITQAELQAMGEAHFTEADTDSDGFLSAAELEAQAMARAAQHAARMMERMDANGDGKLAQDEMHPRRDPAKMFSRLDADSSGAISKEEFEAARAKMKDRHHKKKGPVAD